MGRRFRIGVRAGCARSPNGLALGAGCRQCVLRRWWRGDGACHCDVFDERLGHATEVVSGDDQLVVPFQACLPIELVDAAHQDAGLL